MSGDPFPKSRQLARWRMRRYRWEAGPAQWQRIIAAKQGPCRVCEIIFGKSVDTPMGWQYHHLVPRARGGDDVADNIVPLCSPCHDDYHRSFRPTLQYLHASLSDAERAYCEQKMGAEWERRLFGVATNATC